MTTPEPIDPFEEARKRLEGMTPEEIAQLAQDLIPMLMAQASEEEDEERERGEGAADGEGQV